MPHWHRETASARAFGFAGGQRSVYLDQIRNGKVKDINDFLTRSFAIMGDTTKGMVKGGATALGGQAGGLAAGGLGAGGKAAGAFVGETAVLTSVSAAMEGRFPTAQEFVDNSALILGLKVAGTGVRISKEALADRLITITEKTGTLPKEVARDVKANPEYAKSVLEDPNATTYIFAKTVESAATRMKAKDPLTYLRETQVSVVDIEPRYTGKSGAAVRKLEGKTLEAKLAGNYRNEQTGERMVLSKGAISHAEDSATARGLGKKEQLSREHMEAVARFPALAEKAVLGEEHPNYKDSGATTTSRYYAVMRLENECLVVKITSIKESGKAVGQADIESVERLYDLYLAKKVPDNLTAATVTTAEPGKSIRPVTDTQDNLSTTSRNVNTVSLFNVLEGLKESAFPKKQLLIEKKK